jgi:TonB-linked SusC/RagA family outer membrane protein
MRTQLQVLSKFKILVLLSLFSCLSLSLSAQLVSGQIVDRATQTPVPNASVVAGRESKGAIADIDGNFTLDLKGAKSFTVSVVGYKDQTIAASGNLTFKVELESAQTSMEEVVVVGYGTQKKANLTGAVTTVDVNKTLGSRAIPDVARGLQGAVPGLTITTATGDLGTDPKIRLRGLVGSLNTGADGAKPLILVDNVEIPSLQLINPEDIESISVLKDAASASIYGTRGAFGVILITTKSGKKGAPSRISYSNNLSWAKPTVMPTLSSGADNSEASLSALRRFNPNASSVSIIGYSVDSTTIVKMREWDAQYGGQDLGNEMVKGRDWDIIGGKLFFYRSWQPDKMYMKEYTLMQKHDINVTGGSEKTSYNLGLGYMNQNGVLKVNPDKFDRYNMTLGINSSVNDWVDVRGKVMYSRTKNETPFIFSATQYGPWYYLYRWPANYPYGTYEGKPFRGTIAEVEQAKLDKTTDALARISAGATFKILPGLTVDADYTYTSVNTHLHQTGGGTQAYDFWSFNGTALNYTNFQNVSFNKVRYYSEWNDRNTGRAFATYNKKISNHSFKLIAGGDLEISKFTTQSSERRNLLDPNYGQIGLATGDQFVTGSSSHWSTLGFFGRLNYDYKSKFLLELNGRYDGSSRFPINQLWGFFPSVSAGYVLTEEEFMKSIYEYLSFLKIRGSYGSVGNQAVGGNRFLSVMNSSNSGWILPAGNALTLSTPSALSPTLTWETIQTIDVGVDARFFKNKLGISFDWFQRTTSDMIGAGVTLPSSYGAGSPVRNYGELTGKGWELAVDFNHTFDNKLQITVGGVLSDAVERITKFANTTKSIPGAIAAINTTYYEGMTLGEIWGFETQGLFTESDFSGRDAAGRYIYSKGVASQTRLETGSFLFGPGDVRYKDLNGDGEIYFGTNTVDNPGDKKIIGNSTPRFQYGFRLDANWFNFDFAIYMQGVAKRELWASGPIVFPGFRGSEAWYAHQMDYWTTSNPDAFYPRPTDYGATVDRWNFQPQTRYLLNMAYLRMKNITLGYTLPASISGRLKMSKARIYFNGENLLTFDKLGDVPIDPEIDFSQTQLNNDRAGFGRVYPYRKTFSFGLQVTF